MSRSYFNDVAEVWDSKAAGIDVQKLRYLADRLCIKPGDKILDVGSGTGIFLPFLAEKTGSYCNVFAMDIAENMLLESSKKHKGKATTYIQADISRSPFKSDYFDAIICYSSFPHFADKGASISEIWRILKSGGTFSICHTSSRLEINALHASKVEVCRDLLPDDCELFGMLRGAGFEDTIVEDKNEYYFAAAQKR